MKRIISRWYGIVIGALVALMCTAGIAWTAQARFVKTSTAMQDTGDLMVNFKEAALGANAEIPYEATADVEATYSCVNNGGQCPDAANKTTVTGVVSSTATFTSSANGQITASMTLSAPQAEGFVCPQGQHLEVSAASYENVALADDANDLVVPLGSTHGNIRCF